MLGATIAPNLVPWLLGKIFLLEMVKNDICLGGESKQNALFSENMLQKNALIPPMSRIGSGLVVKNCENYKKNE